MLTAKLAKEIKIDRTYLQSILQRILHSKKLQLFSWKCSLLGKNKAESSVYRVSCTVQINNDKKRNYSIILKILKPESKRNTVDHYYYWKREALVYDSGILEQLPPVIRAPICHAVEEYSDGSIWVWLEDLAIGSIQSEWTLEHMCKISYLLGKYNGAYLTGTPLPNEYFICRTWMRSWVEACTAYAKPIEKQKVIWDSYFNELNGKNAMWGQYLENKTRINSLLETLERLPRVFAHQDVHWDNIFIEEMNGSDSLIAIDWQFASTSGVGEDLGRMFGYALLKEKVPANKVVEYKEEVFLNYMQGLIDVGWNGNSNLARFGFTASASLRFIMAFDRLLSHLIDDDRVNQEEELNHLLMVTQTLLRMAEESWDLRSQII